ncbi:MAG: hypothetical protein GY743_22445 [Planctomycetaceae bacterium]|nr:hypothetical protein [Planctomycetaceae bacterium]
MRKKSIAALAGMLVMVFALYGCWGGKTVTRNIRVIVQAEVDGKIVEGSAIMGLRWQAGGNGRMYVKQNIEAVTLDLNDRSTVYVVSARIGSDNRSHTGYWPSLILRTFDLKGQGRLKDFPTLRSLQGRYPVKPVVGSPKSLPLIISFKDEAKRETMFEVKPDDFPKYFGSDVRYVGMWFEFTEDSPTDSGLRNRLSVMWKANPGFRETFPLRNANGDLIPGVDRAFQEKVGKTAFYKKEF